MRRAKPWQAVLLMPFLCATGQKALALEGEPLKASFRVQRARSVVGGPVGILFELVNVSSSVVTIGLGPGESGFFFQVKGHDGRLLEPPIKGNSTEGIYPICRLGPGQKRTRTIYLGRYFRPGVPGSHKIDCSVTVEVWGFDRSTLERTVLREWLELELVEPQAEELESLVAGFEKAVVGSDAGEAVRALASMTGPRVVEALGKSFASHDRRAVFYAARGLREEGSPAAMRVLVLALNVRTNVYARHVVERSLAHAELGTLVPVLEGMLAGPDPKVREAAVAALVVISKAHQRPSALERMLKNEDERVRRATIALLAGMAERRVVDRVGGMLFSVNDPSPKVRTTAVRELGRVGERIAGQLVQALAYEKDPTLHKELTAAIERIRAACTPTPASDRKGDAGRNSEDFGDTR